MMLTSDAKGDDGWSVPEPPTRDELNALHEAYERALDEYARATTVVMDRIRRRALPSGEEFARKRVAHQTLITTRRAFWRANRRFSSQNPDRALS
jgi:hypothetical protein